MHNLTDKSNAIEVRNNDISGAIRKLKKYVFRENIIKEYMAHTFYEKPSVRKRRIKNETIRRVQKENKEKLLAL